MNMIVLMLLIMTAVAAIALTQATFPAQYGQGGNLSCPEMNLYRVGGAMFFSQAGAIKNRKSKIENLKRLLYFIRAVVLPTSEAVVYRFLGGIRAAVRNVYDSLRKMPMQSPLAKRICRFAIKRYYFGLRLRLQVVPTGNSGGYYAIGKRIEDWRMRSQSWKNSWKLLLPAILDYKRILFLTCLENSPAKTGKYMAIVLFGGKY